MKILNSDVNRKNLTYRMKNFIIISLLLLLSALSFAAKEEVPYWISYPESGDSVVCDYYFKTEFKLKDSVEIAHLKIAASGQIHLWVNTYFVIVNGDASPSGSEPIIYVKDIKPYLMEGKNALSIKLSPGSVADLNNKSMALSLIVNEEIKIFSSKDFICYRQTVNNYKTEKVSGKSYLTFDFNAQKNIVGTWQEAGFEYKRFSPQKWQKALELDVFKVDPTQQTHIPQKVSGFSDITGIAFPKTVKPEDMVELDLPKDKSMIVELGFESVKDKTVFIYTPDMAKAGIKNSYLTTFGAQSFFIPVLINSDKLILEFSHHMKLVGVTYRILNE